MVRAERDCSRPLLLGSAGRAPELTGNPRHHVLRGSIRRQQSCRCTQPGGIAARLELICQQINGANAQILSLRRELDLWDDPGLVRGIESRRATTQESLKGLNTQLEQLANERASADNTAVITLTGATSRGTLASWSLPGAPGGVTLEQLAGMSETDIATLLAAHPELIDKLLTAQTPTQTAAWWQSLTLDQQHALVLGGSALIGALGGTQQWCASRRTASAPLSSTGQRKMRLHKSAGLQAPATSTTSPSVPSGATAASASFRSRTISNGSCQVRSSSTL